MRINRPGQSERGYGGRPDWLTITVLLFLYVDAAATSSVPEESSLRVPSRDIREGTKHGSDSLGLVQGAEERTTEGPRQHRDGHDVSASANWTAALLLVLSKL